MLDREGAERAILQLIEQFVDEHWSKTKTVCYLSSLGIRLNEATPESRLVLSKGLREFLRENPVVRVVQFPSIAEKVGAIPLAAPVPEDVRELFSSKRSATEWQDRKVYIQEFWKAFIRPIEGEFRYVVVYESGNISVREEAPNGDIGKAYKIEKQDLTSSTPWATVVEKVDGTHSAIDAWLKKNSLDYGIFLRPRGSRRHSSTDRKLVEFLSAFEDLSPEDLARVNVPLDIIVKLLARK